MYYLNIGLLCQFLLMMHLIKQERLLMPSTRSMLISNYQSIGGPRFDTNLDSLHNIFRDLYFIEKILPIYYSDTLAGRLKAIRGDKTALEEIKAARELALNDVHEIANAIHKQFIELLQHPNPKFEDDLELYNSIREQLEQLNRVIKTIELYEENSISNIASTRYELTKKLMALSDHIIQRFQEKINESSPPHDEFMPHYLVDSMFYVFSRIKPLLKSLWAKKGKYF